MPFHFCWDEAQAILMAIPFMGALVFCAKNVWHRLWHKGSSNSDGCCTEHNHEHQHVWKPHPTGDFHPNTRICDCGRAIGRLENGTVIIVWEAPHE